MKNKTDNLKVLKEKINIKVTGQDNIQPKTNIYIANHNCLKDIFYLPMALDIGCVSLISPRLMYKNIEPRKKLVRDCLYALPIEAHGGKKYADICLQQATKLLREENNLALNIFPEGAYVKEPIIYKGRTGAARILFQIASQDIPINFVPVAIKVDKEKIDLDSYDFNNDQVEVNILKPIEYRDELETYLHTSDMQLQNSCLHSIIDRSFITIAETLNLEYIDSYIELFPKKNVMFYDGTTIPTDVAQQKYFVDLYKDSLEKESKEIIKQIKKI